MNRFLPAFLALLALALVASCSPPAAIPTETSLPPATGTPSPTKIIPTFTVATSTITLRPSPTAAPTPTRIAPNCNPLTQLHVGDLAVVTTGGDMPNRVRSEPKVRDGNIISLIYSGFFARIINGPVCADEMIWWELWSNQIPGGTGWTSQGTINETWLVPYKP